MGIWETEQMRKWWNCENYEIEKWEDEKIKIWKNYETRKWQNEMMKLEKYGGKYQKIKRWLKLEIEKID